MQTPGSVYTGRPCADSRLCVHREAACRLQALCAGRPCAYSRLCAHREAACRLQAASLIVLSLASLSESLHADGRMEVPSGGQAQGVVGCPVLMSSSSALRQPCGPWSCPLGRPVSFLCSWEGFLGWEVHGICHRSRDLAELVEKVLSLNIIPQTSYSIARGAHGCSRLLEESCSDLFLPL